jgi:GMP synthase (glutamine-hydrolysing)
MARLRYLLLQTRKPDDPIRVQEVDCFARALGCGPAAIDAFDLLAAAPTIQRLRWADVILLGGSGHYSAADIPAPRFVDEKRIAPPEEQSGIGQGGGYQSRQEWLDATMDTLRDIHHRGIPTFASCWGFQAMARALGGRCIHDLPRAELGTIELHLTAAGQTDPVFGGLPATFLAQAGHEDHVVELPKGAILLASSSRVPEQAYYFPGKPIYCTQFHPELDRGNLLERVRAYPEYVERIAGASYEEFLSRCRESPEANSLLRKFVAMVFE